ncbi:MAG: hypothetical protein IPP42_15855 [Saprospiraceae bacterium]|nr:hypothetical protein [Saprospiraceae bacterium]
MNKFILNHKVLCALFLLLAMSCSKFGESDVDLNLEKDLRFAVDQLDDYISILKISKNSISFQGENFEISDTLLSIRLDKSLDNFRLSIQLLYKKYSKFILDPILFHDSFFNLYNEKHLL